jgi:hypothetical protein
MVVDMRYVFYDKQSGQILHTLRVYNLGSDEPQEPTEDDIRAVLQRFPNPDKIDLTRTEVPRASSRQLTRAVDLKTGKVVSTPLVRDNLSQKFEKLTRSKE